MSPGDYKATRERLGTQAAVAVRLQVSRITVARRETGAMFITEEAACALLFLVGGAGGRNRRTKKGKTLNAGK